MGQHTPRYSTPVMATHSLGEKLLVVQDLQAHALFIFSCIEPVGLVLTQKSLYILLRTVCIKLGCKKKKGEEKERERGRRKERKKRRKKWKK